MSVNRIAVLLAAAALATPLLAQTPPDFDLQGHRGTRGLAPENTLAAFAKALEIGVTTLELDLALTKDGVLVVSHDPYINPDIARDSDGKFLDARGPLIRSLTLAEVKQYRLGILRPGTRYAQNFPQQQPAENERYPTLKEVFDLAREAGKQVRFNIEIKTDPTRPDDTAPIDEFAVAVVDLLRAENMVDRVYVQSFDFRPLLVVKKKDARIKTACLTIERDFDNVQRGRAGASPWLAGFDIDDEQFIAIIVKKIGCSVWSPFWRDATEPRLNHAHELGQKVIPWTVNDPKDIGYVIDMGFDGVITDYPDRARKVMQEKGLKLP